MFVGIATFSNYVGTSPNRITCEFSGEWACGCAARLVETGGAVACVSFRGVETHVAFVRAGRASIETAVAFAGR